MFEEMCLDFLVAPLLAMATLIGAPEDNAFRQSFDMAPRTPEEYTVATVEQSLANGFEGDIICFDVNQGVAQLDFSPAPSTEGVQDNVTLSTRAGTYGAYLLKLYSTNTVDLLPRVALGVYDYTSGERGPVQFTELMPDDEEEEDTRVVGFLSAMDNDLRAGVGYLNFSSEQYRVSFRSAQVNQEPLGAFSPAAQVNVEEANSATRLAACGLSDGMGALAYTVRRDGEQTSLQIRLVDALTGMPVGDEVQVNTSANGTLGTPAVACGDDFVAVAWTEGSSEGSADGDGNAISARIFDDALSPLSAQLVVNENGTGSQTLPAVTVDADQNVIFSWTTSGGGVSVRGMTSDGTPCSDEIEIPSAAGGQQGMSRLAANGNGELAIAWIESSTSGPSDSIYALFGGGAGGGSNDSCGDPAGDDPSLAAGTTPAVVTASDALVTLNAAVGLQSCELCVCDVDNSGAVTASDALTVLSFAVGLDVALDCPACP